MLSVKLEIASLTASSIFEESELKINAILNIIEISYWL